MNSNIRPARPADLEAVCAVARDCPSCAGWSPEQYREEMISDRGLFAVWVAGVVKGYFVLRKVHPEAQLVDLAVRPADRGQGIGSALLVAAAQAARGWGCSKMTLEVSAANESALALYRRVGLMVVGSRRKFYNDGSDAILMDLPLT